MQNPMTSIAGIVCILCAAALLVLCLINPVAQTQITIIIPIAISLIAGGIGLIKAKDFKGDE